MGLVSRCAAALAGARTPSPLAQPSMSSCVPEPSACAQHCTPESAPLSLACGGARSAFTRSHVHRGYNKGNRSHFDHLNPCALASYHAHCLVSERDKRASMERMLAKTQHCVSTETRRRAGAGNGAGEGGGALVLGKWGPRASPYELSPRTTRQQQQAKRGSAASSRTGRLGLSRGTQSPPPSS